MSLTGVTRTQPVEFAPLHLPASSATAINFRHAFHGVTSFAALVQSWDDSTEAGRMENAAVVAEVIPLEEASGGRKTCATVPLTEDMAVVTVWLHLFSA